MSVRFNAEERRALEARLEADEPLLCPACGEALTGEPVVPPPEVSYVRRRLWLLCPGCRRSGTVDVPDEGVRGGGRP